MNSQLNFSFSFSVLGIHSFPRLPGLLKQRPIFLLLFQQNLSIILCSEENLPIQLKELQQTTHPNMGNELSIDSCCGIDGRYKDASSAQAEAALKQSWEVEALESWENLDPITYYQYIETRSHDEEKRHRVLQRILYQQNQKPEKVRSYLQEVDDCFDELLGIPQDEPIVYEQNLEMIPMHATSNQHATLSSPPPGSYVTTLDVTTKVNRNQNTKTNTVTTQSSSDPNYQTNNVSSNSINNNNTTTTSKSLIPSATTATATATTTTTTTTTTKTRQAYVTDEQRDQMLDLESNHTEWITKSKEHVRTPLRIYSPRDVSSWPPYTTRNFKVVHLVKGPIDCVWKAWNDVKLRKTYDKGFDLAEIVEKVDDSCDGKLLDICIFYDEMSAALMLFCLLLTYFFSLLSFFH